MVNHVTILSIRVRFHAFLIFAILVKVHPILIYVALLLVIAGVIISLHCLHMIFIGNTTATIKFIHVVFRSDTFLIQRGILIQNVPTEQNDI